MSGPPGNAVRATVGLALVALLFALVWQGSPQAPVPPIEPVVAEAADAAASAPQTFPMPGPPLMDGFAAIYGNAASAAAAAASTPLAADEIEVCGIGRVKAKGGQPLDRTLFTTAGDAARRRLVTTLAQQPDELARAAGLLLQRDEGPPHANAPQACEGADCNAPAEPGESELQRQARVGANASQRDALAQMAVATRSPAVYTLAWRACRASPGGACQMLSTRQLATLDPNNADAWLEVASEADQHGETGLVDEALYRASKATTADLRWGQVSALALRNLPPGTPAIERRAVMARAEAIESALAMPGLKTLMQHCDANAVRDGNRLQVCADIAELLSKRSTTLLDMAIGQALGARVGWPAERLQALRLERDAMSQALKPMAAAPGTEWSCAQIERETRWVLDMSQFGEIGAARMLIARTGQDVAALAKQYSDDRAAAAARAASAPASGVVALAR
jgi:hypothetical protein